MPVSFWPVLQYAGFDLLPRWEHFGDPGGAGDLLVTWENRFGCQPSEQERAALIRICRACEGGYETPDEARAALMKAAEAAS